MIHTRDRDIIFDERILDRYPFLKAKMEEKELLVDSDYSEEEAFHVIEKLYDTKKKISKKEKILFFYLVGGVRFEEKVKVYYHKRTIGETIPQNGGAYPLGLDWKLMKEAELPLSDEIVKITPRKLILEARRKQLLGMKKNHEHEKDIEYTKYSRWKNSFCLCKTCDERCECVQVEMKCMNCNK